jgi:hypothetical protein
LKKIIVLLICFFWTCTLLSQEVKKIAKLEDYNKVILLFEATNQRLFDINNFQNLKLQNKTTKTDVDFNKLNTFDQKLYIIELVYIFNKKMQIIDSIWKNELSQAPETIANPALLDRSPIKSEVNDYINKLKVIRQDFYKKQTIFIETFLQENKEQFSQTELKVLLSQIKEYSVPD